MFESYRLYRKLRKIIISNRDEIEHLITGYHYVIPSKGIKVSRSIYDNYHSSSECVSLLPRFFAKRLLKLIERQYDKACKERDRQAMRECLQTLEEEL